MEIGDCEIEQTFEYLNYKVDSLVKLCVWFYVLHIPIYRFMMDIKVKKCSLKKKKNEQRDFKEEHQAGHHAAVQC